jgi:hypothetical protein
MVHRQLTTVRPTSSPGATTSAVTAAAHDYTNVTQKGLLFSDLRMGRTRTVLSSDKGTHTRYIALDNALLHCCILVD